MKTEKLAFLLSVVVVFGVALVQQPAVPAAAQDASCDRPSSPQVFGTTCGESVNIFSSRGSTHNTSTQTADRASDGPRDRFERRPLCVEWRELGTGSVYADHLQGDGVPECREQVEPEAGLCPEGQDPLLPMWRSPVIDPAGPTYGPWVQVSGFECEQDPLATAAEAAWRQMVISPQTVEVLPSHGWAIATMGVKADLDGSPQTSTVTVLGRSVVLRATPIGQEWSVTDVVSGDMWPGIFETVASHGEDVITFDRKEHRVQLGLTTTWEGHYSLNGGSTWIPAPGTATTTSDPRSVHVYNPRARLVNCDTMGDCIDGGSSRNPFTLTDPDADGIDNHEVPDDQIGEYLKARNK